MNIFRPSISLTHTIFAIGFLAVASTVMAAEPVFDKVTVEILPAKPGKHWVWVNDPNFFAASEGKAWLIDADAGKMLGWVQSGYYHDRVMSTADWSAIYTVDSFYSRGVRGDRTDVVTITDPRTLSPVAEIEVPPKRFYSVNTEQQSGLTDDDRFVLIYNFTPAQSVSVVDMQARRFVGEIDTAGCAFIFPGGARRFAMLCADGSLLTVTLNDDGTVKNKSGSRSFFDAENDPVHEDSVRIGNKWYWVSFKGKVYSADLSQDTPAFEGGWALASDAERADNWMPGGGQLIAAHADSGRLFTLMHQGGPGSHKEVASEVWVHDIATKARVSRFAVKNPATEIDVSPDDEPLMYLASILPANLDIYNATDGTFLRTVEGLAMGTPMVLQSVH